MPLYEYAAKDPSRSCAQCGGGFEVLQQIKDAPLTQCPACGAAVARQITACAVGASQSGYDDRAKQSGFHKLKKTGKGEYEKLY
jgi:putative FmdB family regulatory protein